MTRSRTSSTTTKDHDAAPLHDSCPWTRGKWAGAPIRAIVPLPHRRLAAQGLHGPTQPVRDAAAATEALCVNPRVSPVFLEHNTAMDSGDEHEPGHGSRARAACDLDVGHVGCCSYESITAAEGLSSWSFEELRVECYAQSSIARGTRPPPVNKPSLAIPPAFVPRTVPR
ncbi:hypothetical protein BU15DRAFT_79312 [Melanogaster broomeanus]|nr:hypothetical protein BU15DRAFT_79312 [Melanogaster broomeanus]